MNSSVEHLYYKLSHNKDFRIKFANGFFALSVATYYILTHQAPLALRLPMQLNIGGSVQPSLHLNPSSESGAFAYTPKGRLWNEIHLASSLSYIDQTQDVDDIILRDKSISFQSLNLGDSLHEQSQAGPRKSLHEIYQTQSSTQAALPVLSPKMEDIRNDFEPSSVDPITGTIHTQQRSEPTLTQEEQVLETLDSPSLNQNLNTSDFSFAQSDPAPALRVTTEIVGEHPVIPMVTTPSPHLASDNLQEPPSAELEFVHQPTNVAESIVIPVNNIVTVVTPTETLSQLPPQNSVLATPSINPALSENTSPSYRDFARTEMRGENNTGAHNPEPEQSSGPMSVQTEQVKETNDSIIQINNTKHNEEIGLPRTNQITHLTHIDSSLPTTDQPMHTDEPLTKVNDYENKIHVDAVEPEPVEVKVPILKPWNTYMRTSNNPVLVNMLMKLAPGKEFSSDETRLRAAFVETLLSPKYQEFVGYDWEDSDEQKYQDLRNNYFWDVMDKVDWSKTSYKWLYNPQLPTRNVHFVKEDTFLFGYEYPLKLGLRMYRDEDIRH